MINLRPHHLLCVQGFEGKGYSSNFIKNMAGITDKLKNEKDTAVRVVFKTDDICAECPHKIGENLCAGDDKAQDIDRKVREYFNIEEKVYIYPEIIKKIKSGMTGEIMDDICGRCDWYHSSACKSKCAAETS
jgi:hypothetical protein